MTGKGRLRVGRMAGKWRLFGRGCGRANIFLERLELRGLAVGTLRTYAFDLLIVLRWLHAHGKKACQVSHDDLYAFLRARREHVKAVTLNRHLRILDRLARMDQPDPQAWVIGNRRLRPARSLPCVKMPRQIKRPLTDQQVHQMFTALRTYRDRAIAGLMWATGMRVGEVLALKLEDVEWAQGTLLVHGKGNRERSLPLNKAVAQIVRRYLDLERPRRAHTAMFVVLKGPRRGNPLTYAGVRRLFRYYRGVLRLPQAHPHRFRHTFAANMIRQGLSVPMLMRLLGHSWITTTLKYLHFDDMELRKHYETALARLAQSNDAAAANLRPVL